MPPVVINTSSLPPQVPQWRRRHVPREEGHRGRPSHEKQYKWDRFRVHCALKSIANLPQGGIYASIWFSIYFGSGFFAYIPNLFSARRRYLRRFDPTSAGRDRGRGHRRPPEEVELLGAVEEEETRRTRLIWIWYAQRRCRVKGGFLLWNEHDT